MRERPPLLDAAVGDRQRQGPDPLGRGEGDLLGDHAAERDPEQVEGLEPEVVGQRQRVLRHGAGALSQRGRTLCLRIGHAAALWVLASAEAGQDPTMTMRLAVVALMLATGSIAVRSVGHGVPVALLRPFWQFPANVGAWQGRAVTLEEAIEKKAWRSSSYLGQNVAKKTAGECPSTYTSVMSSQQHGEMIHSPSNCLPVVVGSSRDVTP